MCVLHIHIDGLHNDDVPLIATQETGRVYHANRPISVGRGSAAGLQRFDVPRQTLKRS